MTFLRAVSIVIQLTRSDYTYTRRVVMIAMDREDRYRHIDIRILVVDMIELSASDQPLHTLPTHTRHSQTHPSNCSLASLNISSSHGFSP